MYTYTYELHLTMHHIFAFNWLIFAVECKWRSVLVLIYWVYACSIIILCTYLFSVLMINFLMI